MSILIPRITGTGWSVPSAIRKNDDPIFDWLRKNLPNQNMFEGYDERHVLQPNEGLIDIMVPAAIMALENAGKKPGDIDILLGLGSISEYVQPNMLTQVHKELGLSSNSWVIPIGNDYSNYASCLLLADALIKAQRAKNILICIGGNWTRNVNYHTPQSISAADGAGAAVVSLSDDASKWFVADYCTVTNSANYGTMFTKAAEYAVPDLIEYPKIYSSHFFQITAEGLKDFGSFGMQQAITAVLELLKKNNLTGDDISFMPHQTSQVLIDYWLKQIVPQPAQCLSTMKKFANVTVATHALNLAWFEENEPVQKDNLVMLALGPDMHANAMLLKRNDQIF